MNFEWTMKRLVMFEPIMLGKLPVYFTLRPLRYACVYREFAAGRSA